MTEDKDPMQDVVTILLDRMREYPEEFVEKERGAYRDDAEDYSRFWKTAEAIRRSMRVRANIARDVKGEEPDAEFNDPLWFLSKEERQALYDGMRDAARHMLVVDVMTTLVAPEKPTKEERAKAANAAANQMYNSALSGAVGHPFSGMLAQQQLAQQQVSAEQARANALAAQNVYGRRV